jgi:hypothetical protein
VQRARAVFPRYNPPSLFSVAPIDAHNLRKSANVARLNPDA